jgi:transposase InsO family protein
MAGFIDLYARRVVGWAMSDRQNQILVTDALVMAIERRQPPPGLIHHTDQGNVYATPAYRAILTAQHMLPSMSKRVTATTTPWPRASSPGSRTN